MKIYLVGGAVRDRLLGREVGERDWVVVGASAEALRRQGFKPVGKDFPVFLHPKSGEEYALARTERKTAPGYHGFEFHTDPDVTLEDDLARRDLTINAMAEDAAGNLIDPHGGQADLEARRLRHVSPAFREDPVRILRVARFAARLAPMGFEVAGGTRALMAEMVAGGEADHLVPERVWKELARALGEPRPDVFVRVLRDCGALARVLPELDRLFGIPQPARWHPEVDTGAHVLLALRAAAAMGASPKGVFCVLVHDLGKAATPADVLPSHVGHETRGVPLVEAACKRLGVPRAWRELAVLVTREHLNVHRAFELKPATLVKLLTSLDAWRRPGRLCEVLTACEADARGRRGNDRAAYPQADFIRRAHAAAAAVRVDPGGRQGPEIGRELRRARVAAVRASRQIAEEQRAGPGG